MSYKKPEMQEDGKKTKPIYPVMDRPYRMQCCDCGLVHNIEFKVVKTVVRDDGSFEAEAVEDPLLAVEMVVSRNNYATGQVRRFRRKRGIE